MLTALFTLFALKSQSTPSISRNSDREWLISIGGHQMVLPRGGGGSVALAQVDLARNRMVVPSDELLGLDLSGKVIWKYPFETDFEPRPLVYCGGVVLIGAGQTGGRHEKPDAEMLKIWKEDDATIALDAITGKVLWKGSTFGIGTPLIALSSKEFLSLNIANRQEFYLNGAAEKFKIERVSVTDGRVLQSWRLMSPPQELHAALGYTGSGYSMDGNVGVKQTKNVISLTLFDGYWTGSIDKDLEITLPVSGGPGRCKFLKPADREVPVYEVHR